MNIFECRLVSEDDHIWLKATEQLRFRVDQFGDILNGDHYMVGIRAHAISMVKQTEDMIAVTGKIELGEVVGSDTELHLDHEGVSLIALLEGLGGYELGQMLTAYLPSDRFFIFDKVSGRLIAQTHENHNGK